jgi:hypothetical protein
MSFLENEDDKKSAFWDWFIGIGLVVLIGGFTLYYQMQKRATQKRFTAADTLFQSGDFVGAVEAYEGLKDASYLTAANDSIIYDRLDSIETIEESEKETVARLRTRFAAGDADGARSELDTLKFHGLLSAQDQFWLDSVKTTFTAPATP